MKDDILNKISPDEALKILRQIAKNDRAIKKQIVKVSEELFRNVDVDKIYEDVFYTLDGIDVHELWDRSGSKTDGYCSPEEMAVEMFEEALEPFLQKMNRLSDLKMLEEAKFYCMGIIKGIYEYEKDSRSKFKDWATDMSAESFGYILGQWTKKSTTEDKQEMKEFIGNECPDWAKWAIYKD
jgi:hypothetical protein